MKRILTLMAILFAFMTQATPIKINQDSLVKGLGVAYNDSKGLISTVHDDATALIKYAGVRLDTMVTKAATLIGTAAENLWDILVTQQRVKATTALYFWIISIIVLVTSVKILKINIQEIKESEGSNTGGWAVSTLCTVLILCCIYFNYDTVPAMLTGFFNPEYGAIQDINKILTEQLK